MIQRETSFIVAIPEPSDEIVEECNPDEASPDVSDSIESPKKRSRGKGLNWFDDNENYATLHAVVINAASMNYGKYSSTRTEHRYLCKSIGCNYIKKYHLDNRSGSFKSYHHGVHEHVTPGDEFSPSRGLTIRQKEWVAEAMSLRAFMRSALSSSFSAKYS